MVVLEKADIEFIKEHFNNSEEILKKDDYGDILDELDILMMTKGLDNDYYPNKLGDEIDKVRQNILDNNG